MGSPDQLRTTIITLYTLGCVTVATRCFVRARIVKSFRYDDWLMVVTWMIFSVYASFVLSGIHYGTGRHLVDLTPESIMEARKYWYGCELTYILATTFIKLTIATFLLRIAVVRWHILGLKIVIGVAGIFGLFYIFFGIFQCWPIHKFWLPDTPGFCFSGLQIAISSYAHSTISAAADWYCGILPVFMLKNTTLSMRMKIVVGCILGIGSVGSIASIVRYAYINGFTGDDFLFNTVDLATWSSIEVGLGIIAGSLATFRPLVRVLLDKTGVSTSWNSANRQPSFGGSVPLGACKSHPYVRTSSQKDLVNDTWSATNPGADPSLPSSQGRGTADSKKDGFNVHEEPLRLHPHPDKKEGVAAKASKSKPLPTPRTADEGDSIV